MTAVILAQVVVTDGMLEAVGIDESARPALARLLEFFADRVGTPYVDRLAAAELAALTRAVELAASVA